MTHKVFKTGISDGQNSPSVIFKQYLQALIDYLTLIIATTIITLPPSLLLTICWNFVFAAIFRVESISFLQGYLFLVTLVSLIQLIATGYKMHVS